MLHSISLSNCYLCSQSYGFRSVCESIGRPSEGRVHRRTGAKFCLPSALLPPGGPRLTKVLERMWLPKPAGYLPNYEHKTKQTNKKNSMQQCLFPQKVTKSIWFTPNCFELLKTENFLVHKSTENTSYF